MATKHEIVTLRALFALPPIKESVSTALAVPDMPQQTVTTGDREVDAVLWLQRVVSTGHPTLIAKALEAVKLIETPMTSLADRYADYLRRSGAHPLQVAFGTVGFGDLDKQADRAIDKARNQHEALARFGSVESLFADTPAEKACKKALRGLNASAHGFYDDDAIADRFGRFPGLVPHTIDDCLYVRAYWRDMYRLRLAMGDSGDGTSHGWAHECYCLAMLARIKPRDGAEAIAAFDHLYESDSDDSKEAPAILRNLVVSGWNSSYQPVQQEEQ
ncbi:hypothetical protein [Pararobbsia alpina]|uniref:Uncharacterized protein n=1 Tax=Pararobbsia alpina TaxID=621374 RepID=A0A6S7B3H2_9BURK|nr:hypothetical protein [Pararobbsia alpina]CAB3784238.1 hypothetical protein LMG28138_01769 [Pararobbsia alpina]